MCGLSVVNRDYDRLKRYNLAELQQPIVTVEEKAVASTGETTATQPVNPSVDVSNEEPAPASVAATEGHQTTSSVP